MGHCMRIIYSLSCFSVRCRSGKLVFVSTTSVIPSGPVTMMSGWNVTLLFTVPSPVNAPNSGCRDGIKEQAQGAHPVRGKGSAHPAK